MDMHIGVIGNGSTTDIHISNYVAYMQKRIKELFTLREIKQMYYVGVRPLFITKEFVESLEKELENHG